MDREIKFRVWNGKTKKWVHEPREEVNLFGESILLGKFMYGVSLEELNDCEALQYTGLKDKNNKEIYEGDIIKFMGRWNENGEVLVPNYEPYEVVWFMGGLKAFRINRDKCSSIHHHNDVIGVGNTRSEIIGNIFDNPELLEHKKL